MSSKGDIPEKEILDETRKIYAKTYPEVIFRMTKQVLQYEEEIRILNKYARKLLLCRRTE